MVAFIYNCVRLGYGTHVEGYSENPRGRDSRAYETRFTPRKSIIPDHSSLLHISSQTTYSGVGRDIVGRQEAMLGKARKKSLTQKFSEAHEKSQL
jgi:hypothetical protein